MKIFNLVMGFLLVAFFAYLFWATWYVWPRDGETSQPEIGHCYQLDRSVANRLWTWREVSCP